ncbi:hypothetical protein CVS40_9822 [Lucilia cuprina]|nr:hypothetical protein CVS40_9822 [Lucilia cuprina]
MYNFTPEYGLTTATTTTTSHEKYTHQWTTRHYPVKEEQEKVMEDMLDIHNSYDNHNSSNSGGETDDPLKQYTIQYVDDDNDDNDDDDNNDPCYNDEDICRENKGYRTFLVADYVDYNQETNMSKCLIINCEKPMSGRRTGNIKRHYEKVHNFVIVHKNNKDKEKLTDETATQPACITVNLDKYFDYDPLMNKSYCKMPGCNAALVRSKTQQYYALVHNFKIGAEEADKEGNTSDGSRAYKEPINIPLEDLVALDGDNNYAHCLFITCQALLEKDILTVERHYNEVHKIVIARNGQNVPNRFYRKRMYRYIHQPFENDQEYVENKLREYLHQTDGVTIKQEQENQPHCSKQINKPLIPLGKMGFGKFISQNYVDFDLEKNVSKCLIKHCKRSMSGCLAGNIKRHYLTMHNFVILHGSCVPFEEIEEMSDVRREQIEDLVTYDKNSTYQCLFMNCGVNLEDNLYTIKKHYLEIHKIIIIRYSDYIVQRKRRYRELQQQQSSEMEFYNEDTTPLSDEDVTQKSIDHDTEMEVEKVNYGKMRIEMYVDYDQEKNLSKCLIKHCKRSMSGCLVGNIKRHYLTMHNFVILHGLRSPFQISDGKTSTKVDLLPFYMEISSQQCLFINCNQTLEKDLYLIRKHYHEVHKIIINKESNKLSMPTLCRRKALQPATVTHRSQESILPDEEEENRNLSLMEQNLYSSTIHSMVLSLGRRSIGKFNMSQYVDYDKEKNLAKCLIKHCKRSMSGCIVGNIKRHYKRMHNFVILHGIRLPNEEFQEIFDNSVIDELVAFDIASSSFQCIFNNCSQVLEKDLPSLKVHYCKVHQVAIAKDPECDIKRKLPRKYHELYETPFETEFLEEESCSVRNEYLSEEDDPTDYLEESMNCPIKREYISDGDDDGKAKLNSKTNIFPIITENPLENKQISQPSTEKMYKPILHPTSTSLKENSTTVNIDLTKLSFLNLCLGLVIERDMPLQYFDDAKYFKALLAPYEQVFACNINATKMRSIMLKANHIVVEDLSKRFCNKILCLELYVLKRFGIYYMIINVRFLAEEIICNKLIEYISDGDDDGGGEQEKADSCFNIKKAKLNRSFPITETTKPLPLNKYLNKFNIDEQQIYMKTIMPEFHNEEEIYNICHNICKHNTDIKNHPIYDLQIIFSSFIKKYSHDIKNWQKLSGHQETVSLNKNMLENLKEFSEYLEKNSTENNEQLLPAIHFFKALQIFWNFKDKLRGEQYVAGDFYRDLLCCELGLKGEHNKSHNFYANELYEKFCDFKNKILESQEFVAALYLDARFNFLGTRLIGDDEQNKGKLYLCEIWDKYKTYLQLSESPDNTLSNAELNNEEFNDDEYALLTQHINDTMPVKTNVSIQYKLSNFIPTKRQPISMDILKYWHSNCQSMEDINELTKIAFTHSASQFILLYLETNFSIPLLQADEDNFDKLLLKSNQELLEENIAFILEDL